MDSAADILSFVDYRQKTPFLTGRGAAAGPCRYDLRINGGFGWGRP